MVTLKQMTDFQILTGGRSGTTRSLPCRSLQMRSSQTSSSPPRTLQGGLLSFFLSLFLPFCSCLFFILFRTTQSQAAQVIVSEHHSSFITTSNLCHAGTPSSWTWPSSTSSRCCWWDPQEPGRVCMSAGVCFRVCVCVFVCCPLLTKASTARQLSACFPCIRCVLPQLLVTQCPSLSCLCHSIPLSLFLSLY